MSAEFSRVTRPEAWANWERLVINGIYPLHRFLGGSDHSAVFLTEYRAENVSRAAIKFVPADTLQTEVQLVQWGTAATVSHPHLVRLFDVGRCRIRGRGFVFVVMEYAEQTLAEILPKRALSPDEVRELLPPTLDALAFLHRNYLAHGQLRPSNFLVVNDQLKLASDTVRPIGNSTTRLTRTSSYDPPELSESGNSAAGDVWGLGITLVEALTQRASAWGEDRSETATLLTTLPPPFVDTVLRCLSRAPNHRPTIMELESQYSLAPQAPEIPASAPLVHEPALQSTSPTSSSKGPVLISAVVVVLLIALAVWVGLQDFDGGRGSVSREDVQPVAADGATVGAGRVASAHRASAREASATGPSAPLASAPVARVADPVLEPPPSAVLHEEIPDVPRSIRERVRGHVNVTVRVLVDPSGNVVGEFMENPGPSRYFARLAADAAGKWAFAAVDSVGSRVWLLRFEFTRDGANVHAVTAQ